MSQNGQAANEQWVRDALECHEIALVRYAARLTGSSECARDVVQETFLRLCRQNRSELDGHLAQWLYTVCRNRALTVRRKETRMTALSETAIVSRVCPAPAPAEAAERGESRGRMLEQVAALPERQQEVLMLKFQSGLSYRDIAGVLEISASNVGFLIHTAIKTLRERMGARNEV